MQIFELHFNPKSEKDSVFDTFYYEPENIHEKRLGSLFMLGELESHFEEDRFLKNLARTIKNQFYSSKIDSVAKSLRRSLKQGNSFLEELIKQGDTSWLANLHFAVLVLTPLVAEQGEIKRYKIGLTKTGQTEIVLMRSGEILNLGKKLSLDEIEPYPLKVFPNIIYGNAEHGDRIAILSKQAFKSFSTKKLLDKVAKLSVVTQDSLASILKESGENISGNCLIIDLGSAKPKQQNQTLVFKEKISQRDLLSPFKTKLFPFISEIWDRFSIKLSGTKIFKPFKSQLRFVKKLLDKVFFLISKVFNIFIQIFKEIKEIIESRRIFLVIGLITILFLGQAIVKLENNLKNRKIRNDMAEIQQMVEQANALLIVEQNNQAKEILLQAQEKIDPLSRMILSEQGLEQKIDSIEQLIDQILKGLE